MTSIVRISTWVRLPLPLLVLLLLLVAVLATMPLVVVPLLLLVIMLVLLCSCLWLMLLPGLLRTKDIAAALSVPCSPPDRSVRIACITSADPLAYWLAKDNCSAANASAASSCSGDRLGITEAKCALLSTPDEILSSSYSQLLTDRGWVLCCSRAAGISSMSICTWTPLRK